MALTPGTRLGVYEVVASIGEGGMGQVFRARDTKLDRDVAIKILPEAFAHDADRLARFQREAKTLASLNHQNIAAIYGLEESGGMTALVMELVEGDDLSQRIARGAIPLDETLPIAKQIAEALEAAHEQGIIHRDLKPANVKVRPDGTVKVLDFGLAKAMDPVGVVSSSHSMSPTITTPAMTRAGLILGTAAYMSPEQAKGTLTDKRSDVWAFGCVLYEMLTARRAFNGEDVPDTLAAVLRGEPDWTALPAGTPLAVRRLLRRSLERDRRRRLADIADAQLEIDEAVMGPAVDAAPAVHTRVASWRRLWLPVAALVVAVAAGVASMAWYGNRRPVEPREVRFDITTPPTTDPASLAVSPDGRLLAFAATSDGKSQLWLRSLDTTSMRPLAGTDDASRPFWSPDSRSIGFFANGQLKRIDVNTGSVQVLGPSASLGGAWNPEGTLLFVRGPGGSVQSISSEGGQPAVAMPSSLQANVFSSPQFLPDGRRFLVHAQGTQPGVYIGGLGASEAPRRLIEAEAGVYASSGHLLFVRQGTLFAQRFDPGRLQLTGDSTVVAEGVAADVDGQQGPALSVSAAGPIAYRTGIPQTQFVWFDRSGTATETVVGSDVSAGFNSSLSSDDRLLAMSRNVGGTASDIWLLDLTRGALSRFTTDEAFDLMPVWSPDGAYIALSSNRDAKTSFDLYAKPVSGVGDERLLVAHERGDQPTDWSRDGQFILYNRQISVADRITIAGHNDIWALAMDGDRKPFPVVETMFDETNGQFSPDGKWIAYQSNETGQPEVYVQTFPGPARKTQVSIDGGVQARWRRDGRELFYLTPNGRLMAVTIRIDSTGMEIGKPVPLFTPQIGGQWRHPYGRNYMVSRDGQRFLVETPKEVSIPVTVILNWSPDR